MYHRGRHATKQETLHCCPSVPAKHDQVGIPFFGYAYNGFDNYVFQNRTFRSKTSSPQGLHGQVERPLCLTNFFLRDIQRNHLQDFHFRSLGPALSDDGAQCRFRKSGAVECKENFHDWLSLSPGRRCFRLFAGLTDGSDFGHHDFEHVVLTFAVVRAGSISTGNSSMRKMRCVLFSTWVGRPPTHVTSNSLSPLTIKRRGSTLTLSWSGVKEHGNSAWKRTAPADSFKSCR